MGPSDEEILAAVRDILKDADLNTTSAKKVRKILEERFGVDLTERKKKISEMTLEVVDELTAADGDGTPSPSEDEESEVETKSPAKRKSSGSSSAAAAAKRTKTEAPAKRAASKPKKRPKAEGDEDGESPRKKSSNSYQAMLDLSPELADVMGQKQMRRSEVVSKMWAVIRERQLKDPKDGRFHICDDQLLKVFGKKRVLTFGMMKYLKDHMK